MARDYWPRPLLHFAPPQGFMNDPNGLVYHRGRYHLFYQHNPYAPVWGHMSWGHAVGPSLLDWEDRPVALPEQPDYMVFSGSAVVDRDNTAGFGADALVAVYTAHYRDDREAQCLAYSLDGGERWTFFEGNPVLVDPERPHVRDPQVFWYEPGGYWVMAVARADDRQVAFYASDDLKRWELLSTFGPAGCWREAPHWECPALLELPVDGSDRTHWLLKVDVDGGAPTGGSGAQYFTGYFDGVRFVPDDPSETVRWVEAGPDFYAAQAFNHMPDGRRVWLGWMNNWRYANALPTYPWRGMLTIPRALSMVEVEGRHHLVQRPCRECYARMQPVEAPQTGRSFPLPEAGLLRLRMRTGGPWHVRFFTGTTPGVVVGYDAENRRLFLDRRAAGRTDFSPDFPGRFEALLPPEVPEELDLEILFDRYSLEVFAPQARLVLSALVFPAPGDRAAVIQDEGESIREVQLSDYAVASASAG